MYLSHHDSESSSEEVFDMPVISLPEPPSIPEVLSAPAPGPSYTTDVTAQDILQTLAPSETYLTLADNELRDQPVTDLRRSVRIERKPDRYGVQT